ncbi:MAG: hypothetical protein R3Y43_06600 [Alphaproteobacteria bacterium]
MTDLIIFSTIALCIILISYFWLNKTYINSSLEGKSFLYDGFAEIFYFIISIFAGIFFIFINDSEFITPLKSYQLFAPLLLSGILIIYPKTFVLSICSLIIALITPSQAITFYLPEINIYLAKLIIFVFLFTFSFAFKSQKTIEGIPFIQTSALGLVLAALYYFRAAPLFYSLLGCTIAIISIAMFAFASSGKIAFQTKDGFFFGFFISCLIVLSSAEYLLLPCLVVSSMFFINTIYNLSQKIINFKFKENYDIYYTAHTKENIQKKDLYSYTTKAYFIMGIISLAPIEIKEIYPIFIISTTFGSWLLYRTYTLYQEKASWKGIIKDIKNDVKETIEKQKDDKKD